jgi:hypothetical protein
VIDELVETAPDVSGLGEMIAQLVRSNIESDPARAGHVRGPAGRINIHATDADAQIGMLFTGVGLRIGEPLPNPDIVVECDSQTLMELANVRLLLGRPDPTTPEGRALIKKLLTRELVVHGQFAHPKLLTRLQKLFTVAR